MLDVCTLCVLIWTLRICEHCGPISSWSIHLRIDVVLTLLCRLYIYRWKLSSAARNRKWREVGLEDDERVGGLAVGAAAVAVECGQGSRESKYWPRCMFFLPLRPHLLCVRPALRPRERECLGNKPFT